MHFNIIDGRSFILRAIAECFARVSHRRGHDKTNTTANIGVQCFVALIVFVLLGNVVTQ